MKDVKLNEDTPIKLLVPHQGGLFMQNNKFERIYKRAKSIPQMLLMLDTSFESLLASNEDTIKLEFLGYLNKNGELVLTPISIKKSLDKLKPKLFRKGDMIKGKHFCEFEIDKLEIDGED